MNNPTIRPSTYRDGSAQRATSAHSYYDCRNHHIVAGCYTKYAWRNDAFCAMLFALVRIGLRFLR